MRYGDDEGQISIDDIYGIDEIFPQTNKEVNPEGPKVLGLDQSTELHRLVKNRYHDVTVLNERNEEAAERGAGSL